MTRVKCRDDGLHYAVQGSDTPELNDRLWLLYHYWQERKSTVEIGREIGTSATAVQKALEYWKIPKRDSPGERMEELEA